MLFIPRAYGKSLSVRLWKGHPGEDTPDVPPEPTAAYTRVWWSDDEDDYTDIPVTGELTQDSLLVDGHTYGEAVKIKIGSNVSSIGAYAFNGYESLEDVFIPQSVVEIYDGAFAECINLRKVRIEDADAWCQISYPNLMQPIFQHPYDLYLNDQKITNLVIPNSITAIDAWRYQYCTSLMDVTIPDSVTSISYGAFRGCANLANVSIGNGVKDLEDVFSDCSESLYDTTTIPGVTLVDGWVVGHNDNLPSNLDLTGSRGLCYMAFGGCEGLTSVTIPDSMTIIGNSALEGCRGLTSMTIPDSVTSIGDGAFYQCSGLTSITIGNGVTSIGSSAFSGCTSLANITIGDNVTSIDEHAFSSCYDLRSITIPKMVTIMGNEVFMYSNGITRAVFQGKTLEQVQDIRDRDNIARYPWGLNESAIHAEPPEPEPQTVTISWNLNGGTDGDGNTSIPDSVVEVGSAIPIPTVIRTGYTFAGWWNGNVQLVSGTSATTDVAYTAMWTEQSQVDPDQPPEVDPETQASV